jgi:hypothetical protein
MAKNLEDVIFSEDLTGGDTFILEETNKPVIVQNTLINPPLDIESAHTTKWTYDTKLTKENKKVFKDRVNERNQ